MTTRIGINGFGRIGRQVFKAAFEAFTDELEVMAINDIADLETMAHLLKYDSNYGQFPGDISVEAGDLVVDGRKVQWLEERDPANLPWDDLGVDIVIESTGIFREREKAAAHLEAGAKKVIISAPAKGPDATFVLGVNEDTYDPDNHHVVSNASCTTNCLAPVAKVVNDSFDIRHGLMTTVHSYTTAQRILDLPHKDLRRARAAALNIIPTTTGAARALALVIPELEGRFDGFALRVPTPTVSLVDLTATVEQDVTVEDVNNAFKEAAASDSWLGHVLGVTEEPLVSMDLKGDPRSSIVDLPSTMVMGGDMVKIISWYDNEWGYSVRLVDLASYMAESL
ncbi:MAG: Glyceraldehyde-3-phosphate dehydrogenase [Anaerolineales bacterium]|nr:Glyceraldehyde-3-phosphate dehydrogenase [Anaerolineales bacterium]